jgi:hypothetical protein
MAPPVVVVGQTDRRRGEHGEQRQDEYGERQTLRTHFSPHV